MRLEARRRLGFYPAQPALMERIASRLQVSPEAVLLDPCAGGGDAVATLAQRCGIRKERVYAIELDRGRSESLEANEHVGNVLGNCDGLSARINGLWSLLYLNPPFDDEIGGGGRMEETWFNRFAANAAKHSVIVFVAPHKRMTAFSPAMRKWAAKVWLDRVPKSMAPYDEVVAFCLMLGDSSAWGNCDYKWIDATNQPAPLKVLAGKPLRSFAKCEYTDAELIEFANESRAFELLNPTVQQRELARPPLELSTGHLSLLLAAGHLNGVVSSPGLPLHVVRGSAAKQKYEKSKTVSVSKTTTVYGERIRLVIRCLLANGSIRTIESSEAEPDSEDTEEDAPQ